AAESRNQQGNRPVVRAVSWRKRPGGQGSVRPPSHVGCVAGAVQSASTEKTEVKKKATQRGQPKTKRIQPWKRHVPRADHQWDQVVRKPKQDGNGHEENHGRPVHGEQAVENLRRNEVVARVHQLYTDDDGL